MNINKTIHEARGLVWREITTEKREFKFSSGGSVTFTDFVCKCCDGPRSGCQNVAPDYAAPVHYCALMDWMREDWLRWYRFKDWFDSGFPQFLNKPRQEQITLIAEAIEAGELK